MEYLSYHVSENKNQYRLVVLGYVAGIIIGALAAGFCSQQQLAEIFAFIKDFFLKISTEGSSSFDIFKTEFGDNLKNVLLIAVLGLSAIGVVAITAAAGVKGFASGFTIAILFKIYGAKSLLMILFGILPSDILILPAYLYLSVECMKFYKTSRLAKSVPYKQQIVRYSFTAATAFFVICCGIIVEAYLVPSIIRAISELFIG